MTLACIRVCPDVCGVFNPGRCAAIVGSGWSRPRVLRAVFQELRESST